MSRTYEKPKRNCDRYETIEAAVARFRETHPWSMRGVTELGRWLYDTKDEGLDAYHQMRNFQSDCPKVTEEPDALVARIIELEKQLKAANAENERLRKPSLLSRIFAWRKMKEWLFRTFVPPPVEEERSSVNRTRRVE